jgi:hypothetical protein
MLMRSPVRLFADGLLARRSSEHVDGLWLVAGGWSAILTDIPVDSPDMGEPPRYWEVRLPGRTSAWSRPSPSVGAPLSIPPGSQPFPPTRVNKVRSAAATEAQLSSWAGGAMLGDSAWRVIDSEKAGRYSPLDFPPFGRFVLGFLETERERGR